MFKLLPICMNSHAPITYYNAGMEEILYDWSGKHLGTQIVNTKINIAKYVSL